MSATSLLPSDAAGPSTVSNAARCYGCLPPHGARNVIAPLFLTHNSKCGGGRTLARLGGFARYSGTFCCAFGTPSLLFLCFRGVPMGNKLYVGNLPYTVRDEDLQQSFGQFGAVTSAKVMM